MQDAHRLIVAATLTTAASGLSSSHPPGAFCPVESGAAAEVDAVVSAAELALAAGFAVDDRSAAQSAVSALRSAAQAPRGDCFAAAESAAPAELPAVVRPDDHSAPAAAMAGSAASDDSAELP